MERLFLRVLNMSLAASYVILATLLVRLALKKAPRKYSYALWSATAFRLCCPVSFPAVFSLFGLLHLPQKGGTLEFISANPIQPEIHTGVRTLNTALESVLPAAAPAASANPMQIYTAAGAAIWLAGMAGLLLYALVSTLVLHRRLRTATLLEPGVYQSEAVRSPFLFGIFRPNIYLPYAMNEEQRQIVLTHERFHLRRHDPALRLLAYFLLVLHWFNPLVWLAFFCMSRDMETRCDEHVLATSDAKSYSLCLLSVAAGRPFPTPGPIAFGETGVKTRIRHALHWKKPRRWLTAAAVALCALALLSCAANPWRGKYDGSYRAGKTVLTAIVLSYIPEDGSALGFDAIRVSGNTLQIDAKDKTQGAGEYTGTAEPYSVDRETLENMVLALYVGGTLPEDYDEELREFVRAVDFPEYDDPSELEVYEFYGDWKWEKPTSYTYTKLRPDYTLYFFRGEPLWFSTGGWLFEMEKN